MNQIYYKANKKHPGIYEIYRVDVANGESEALTDLGGMNDYALMSMAPKRLYDFPRSEPDSPGIPQSLQSEVLKAPFNDIDVTDSSDRGIVFNGT